MEEKYTRYCVQVLRHTTWVDYFLCDHLDLAKHKLAQFKNEKWEWEPEFRIVERFVIEKVVSEHELVNSSMT